MGDATKKILDDHERRIKILEDILSKGDRPEKAKDYTGLSGGLRHLIEDGFLNQPKSLGDISNELKRNGYYHPVTSVSKILSVNFTRQSKILIRMKDNVSWKYVLRN